MDILIRKMIWLIFVRHQGIRRAAMQKVLSVRWQTDSLDLPRFHGRFKGS